LISQLPVKLRGGSGIGNRRPAALVVENVNLQTDLPQGLHLSLHKRGVGRMRRRRPLAGNEKDAHD
jgi:hypothetical protein